MYFQCLSKFSLALSKGQCHIRNLLNNKVPFQIKTQVCRTKFTYCKKSTSVCFNVENLLCKRKFHSSSRRNALSPVVLLVVQSLSEITAMVVGRCLRTKWKILPENKRIHVLKQVKIFQTYIIIGSVLFSSLLYTFYLTHLVEDPITKRKRFLIFSEKEVVEMAQNEVNDVMEDYKSKIMKSGYEYTRALKVSQKIISANSHLPGIKKNWKVIVINDPAIDAFVSPSGEIFIFTGMFGISNRDQLAGVIAHEIAHVLLSHPEEVVSKLYLSEFVIPVSLLAWCALVPGSLIFTFVIIKFLEFVLFYLPFKRNFELEADTLGLEMLSRACFDPRQVSLFWKTIDKIDKEKRTEWLSTHPSHEKRYKLLEEHMPTALKIFSGHCMNQNKNERPSKHTYIFV